MSYSSARIIPCLRSVAGGVTRSVRAGFLLAGFLSVGLLSTGCNTPLAAQGLDNYDHGPDKPIESWTQTAGSEGRADKTMQKSNEPDWFRNLLTSQKARDIERNLGFE